MLADHSRAFFEQHRAETDPAKIQQFVEFIHFFLAEAPHFDPYKCTISHAMIAVV